MIRAIPYQPIDFTDERYPCKCDPLDPPLLFNPDEDELRFEILVDGCGNNLLPASDFVGTNWRGGLGWTLFQGAACGSGIAGAALDETSFTPTVGVAYRITFYISSIRDTVQWSFGGDTGTLGTSGSIGQPGQVVVNVLASAPAGMSVALGTIDSEVCFAMIEVVSLSDGITVEVIDAAGEVAEEFTTVENPSAFDFVDGRMVFTAGIADTDLSGCFTVRVTEECEEVETVLESQTMRVTDDDCTLKLRACGGLGFASPMEMRFKGRIGRPSWEYDVSEERRSNGAIVRHYADAQRKVGLFITFQSGSVHEFLSKLPLFASVFIGQDEYVVDADGYEPGYGDVFMATGGVQLTIRPKEELMRRVSCGTDPTVCTPPPNLLVQGLGPNENLILTEDGKAILLD